MTVRYYFTGTNQYWPKKRNLVIHMLLYIFIHANHKSTTMSTLCQKVIGCA